MLIDTGRARYLVAVSEAIEAGRTDLGQLTDTCPECGVTVNIFATSHVVISQFPPTHPEHATSTDAYVVVGCEDYWVIDPNRVGIDSPHWVAWNANMDAAPGAGFPD